MELVESTMEQIHFPSKNEMDKMTNYELFELANLNSSFRKVLIKFISSIEVKPIVVIYDEEGYYNIRKIGLSERLKNVLLQNDFEYLIDFTHVRSKDLFQMKNFGEKSYNELLNFLDKYGLRLAD
jgi:DNA-directed RNA polymerase alpha subunit